VTQGESKPNTGTQAQGGDNGKKEEEEGWLAATNR
jgi:hypothetical protein